MEIKATQESASTVQSGGKQRKQKFACFPETKELYMTTGGSSDRQIGGEPEETPLKHWYNAMDDAFIKG